MVDIKESIVDERIQMEIKSDKFQASFFIRPTQDGFAFYEVFVKKGKLPKALESKFTGINKAKQAVLKYIENRRESPFAKRAKRYDPATTTGSK